MAAYTLANLLSFFRTDLDDTATDYLWSDEEFYRFLDAAQRQFARDTRYFLDRTTSAICQATVTAGQNYITLDPRILEVVRAQLNSNNRQLRVLNLNELDHHVSQIDSYESWEITSWSESTGTPKYLALDLENDQARLIPYVPATGSNDQVNLWVVRDPLTDIDNSGSTVEVADRNDQMVLLDYCKYLAYSKQDADVLDLTRATEYLAMYRMKADEVARRLQKLRRRPGAVKYGGL